MLAFLTRHDRSAEWVRWRIRCELHLRRWLVRCCSRRRDRPRRYRRLRPATWPARKSSTAPSCETYAAAGAAAGDVITAVLGGLDGIGRITTRGRTTSITAATRTRISRATATGGRLGAHDPPGRDLGRGLTIRPTALAGIWEFSLISEQMNLVQALNVGSHVGNEPHPVGGILAFQNPDGIVQAFPIPLGAQRLLTRISLVAYLRGNDFRRHFFRSLCGQRGEPKAT